MWNISQLCRWTQALRVANRKLLVSNTQNKAIAVRQLITTTKCNNGYKLHSFKGFRLIDTIKSSGIIIRFCSSTPKPKQSKAVGYWLLGCSGMVFTAVVLGMVAGYLTLLYSIYYVINIILKTSNGSK